MPNDTPNNNASHPPLPYESRLSPAKAAKAMMSPMAKGMLLGSVVVIGGLVLIASEPTRCRGGTRSAKLKWEQRRAEIDQTVDAQTSDIVPQSNGA
jgi:hypothetical protein